MQRDRRLLARNGAVLRLFPILEGVLQSETLVASTVLPHRTSEESPQTTQLTAVRRSVRFAPHAGRSEVKPRVRKVAIAPSRENLDLFKRALADFSLIIGQTGGLASFRPAPRD